MSIFKAYDIRGVVPTELNAESAYRIGRATARFLRARRLAIGRDARTHSPELGEALVRGVREEGACVLDIGLAATPMLYFAVDALGADGGIMLTASHNPAQYNGMSFRFAFPRWKSVEQVSLSRRYVLGSFGFGLLSALVIKTNPLQTESTLKNNRLIRPPGSLPEDEFVTVCTGCGQCLKVCPNNALQSTLLEAGLAGLYTPRLVPRIGYCEEFCNFCGRVCPTAAIKPLPVAEKRLIQMGVAHINKTRCIAWDTDKICLVCNEQCSYQAIVGDEKKRPLIKEEKCTG